MAAPATAARTRVSEGRSKYQCLVAVSVPQRSQAGLSTGQNDLAMPGDIVELTDAEAANLMATGGRTGRQHPAIRPVSQAKEALPRLLPRLMSGPVRQPAAPPPGTDGPRPDPAGSTRLLVSEIPEQGDPVPGAETHPVGADADALDLPPRGV